MVYAIVGIPLTLLTITNLGGFMATAFRWFYKNVVCGLCCCKYCCEEPEAKRRRAASEAAAAAVAATRTVAREAARSDAKRPDTADALSPDVGDATGTSEVSVASASSGESSPNTVREIGRSLPSWESLLDYTQHHGLNNRPQPVSKLGLALSCTKVCVWFVFYEGM